MKASTQARQLRLIEKVLQTKDDFSLKQMEEKLLTVDKAPTLDERLEMALAEGIADHEAGRLHSHEEMLQVLDKNLGLI